MSFGGASDSDDREHSFNGRSNDHGWRSGNGHGWGSGSGGGHVSPIPEPSTYILMLAGLGAVAFVARRRRAG